MYSTYTPAPPQRIIDCPSCHRTAIAAFPDDDHLNQRWFCWHCDRFIAYQLEPTTAGLEWRLSLI